MSWTGIAVTLSVTFTLWFPNVVVVVFGWAAAADAGVGCVKLSVITTRGFVLVRSVALWSLALIGLRRAPTMPYENNTQPTNVPRLKSRLNVIFYLVCWNCEPRRGTLSLRRRTKRATNLVLKRIASIGNLVFCLRIRVLRHSFRLVECAFRPTFTLEVCLLGSALALVVDDLCAVFASVIDLFRLRASCSRPGFWR